MSPWLHVHLNANWTFPWFVGGVDVAVCEECSCLQRRSGQWGGEAGTPQAVPARCSRWDMSGHHLLSSPARPNHGREGSACGSRLCWERQTFVSPRQIINGTLIQPGAWGWPCLQVLNQCHLTFPFPVLAALLPVTWRQPCMPAWCLQSCQMSKAGLPNLVLPADMSVPLSSL